VREIACTLTPAIKLELTHYVPAIGAVLEVKVRSPDSSRLQTTYVNPPADRRPIDPPPIVQLRVFDTYPTDPSNGASSSTSNQFHHQPPQQALNFLQNPYYFMFASLARTESDDELHLLNDGKTRYTTGSVVSSLYHLKDTENGGEDAGFFIFPDLSVRTEGSYRLKLALFELVG